MIVAEGADYGGRRVTRTDMKTGKSYIIAGLFEGRPFNSPNDITIDEKGRIYFSDPRYLGHEPIDQPVSAVYRIDPDGSIAPHHHRRRQAERRVRLARSEDALRREQRQRHDGDRAAGGWRRGNPSGVDVPLKKGHMALLAYDLAPDGTAKFRKTLVDYAPQDGPDGLVCDKDGNLYVAVRAENRPGICVYSPEGKELAYIKTEVPTNVGFGRGKDAKTLYITAGKSLYRIRLNREGYQLPTKVDRFDARSAVVRSATHSHPICVSSSPDHVSPSSRRNRASTRHLATRTAPGCMCSSAATSAADLPSTTTSQNACQVVGWNSPRIASIARLSTSLMATSASRSSSSVGDESGTAAARCEASVPPTASGSTARRR